MLIYQYFDCQTIIIIFHKLLAFRTSYFPINQSLHPHKSITISIFPRPNRTSSSLPHIHPKFSQHSLIYKLIIEFTSYINLSCIITHIKYNPNSIQCFDNQTKIIGYTQFHSSFTELYIIYPFKISKFSL